MSKLIAPATNWAARYHSLPWILPMCALFILGTPFLWPASITYTYDPAGRLIQADYGNGTGISYTYDSAGNLLRMEVGAIISPPAITSISQSAGPMNAEITISGHGFTAGGNTTVQFNGVAANILSISDTQIVVTVPNGAAAGFITVTNAAGTGTTPAAFTVTQPASQVALNVPAGASAVTSSVGPSNNGSAGYATLTVNSGSAPYGTAVFSYKQNGVVVSEVGVPSSPPTKSAKFFVDYRTTGPVAVYTGFAAVNQGTAAATLTLTLRDKDGNTLAAGATPLKSSEHIAKFLDQLAPGFQLPSGFVNDGLGSMEVSSDQPVSILALRLSTNQRGDSLLTSTPIADLSAPAVNTPIYFPQIADGGGYQTTLIFLNTSNAAETGVLQLYDNFGAPLPVRMTSGGAAAAQLPYSIPRNGFLRLVTDGSPAGVNAGWARLVPDSGTSTPVGAGVFSYTQNNILVTESGVPAATPTTHARIYVDKSGGHDTGLAIANGSNAALHVVATSYQTDGTTPAGHAPGAIDLVALGHDAKFVGQIIQALPDDFTGVLDLSSSTPFAALTLRSLANRRGDFLLTTFPIADATKLPPSPLVFPQIADGGGYQTQIILISTSSAAASFTLKYLDNNGQLIAIGQ
jgi:YD repeat-containing protein